MITSTNPAQIQLKYASRTSSNSIPMASPTSLLPKTTTFPFLSSPFSLPSAHFTKPLFFTQPGHLSKRSPSSLPIHITQANKKNPWFDLFDDGEDPDMEYGSLFADGKQEEDPRLPDNPDNPYGFLKFPMGYTVELASLPLKIRGDVRRCCCVVSGGVYENLLFFPVIQLLKDRYPGVQVDVITTARGKQTYEMNKNVRWADVYDPDDDWPEPDEYTNMIGAIKNRYYDMILSTKLAGLGHAAFLFMSTARDRVSYIYPNVNAAGAGLLLSQTFTAESMNLSEGGYNMYQQMVDWLGRPFRSVPRTPVPPLRVLLSRRLKEAVAGKYKNAGVEKGKYVVIHGIESDSKASMQSRGDTDSLLQLQKWAEIAEGTRRVTPLFVIPHEKERENVEEIVDEDTNIVFITTPGQLAALINDSAGVIATNTAALQLANARGKPSIALFSSELKGRLFIPNAEEKKCTIVPSKTGILADIEVQDVINAMEIFNESLALT
ncbi:photosynthetic NDH subunit of subcomplex B 1, chloroplastic-like [Mangifera indica]|uniref:photosynthetic NDH subunit of subcomplex B 1, chloroplastic-like n=1 Tax=Mangifera indica TaxID=29780 RepID=UPI001CFA5A89|nr:photosynthetic NDH subunit of subcomplex B 1, chloroplastic-like [Mangifera indica]